MKRYMRGVLAFVLLLLVWVAIKYVFGVSDRYFPSFSQVAVAIDDTGLRLIGDTAVTAARIVIGFTGGVVLGIAAALLCYRVSILNLLMPSLNAIRAVPPVALIPFFLLWFGFSETGRFVLILVGLGVNIFIAAAQFLISPSEKDRILFMSYPVSAKTLVIPFWLPKIAEGLLPTLRFGLSTAVGLVVVAEMLGSQSGLGYLMQTSRATLSLHVILLATVILGLMTALFDSLLQRIWGAILFWRIS
jgi:taurine transport system permease protein